MVWVRSVPDYDIESISSSHANFVMAKPFSFFSGTGAVRLHFW